MIDKNVNHDHIPDSEKILNRQKLTNCLKRKAVDNPSDRPSKILHKELKKGNVNTLTIDDVHKIRNNLYE